MCCPFVTIVTGRRSVRCILSGCGERKEENRSELLVKHQATARAGEQITLLILQSTFNLNTNAEVWYTYPT